jgi:hypothetical protein
VLILLNQKNFQVNQLRQALDFSGPRVAQLRWLAIESRFIQRLLKRCFLPDAQRLAGRWDKKSNTSQL